MVRNFFSEFKAFALKGNVIDLAVGVVIGVAFTNVVNSIVKNVVMPLISYVTPKTDFAEWKIGKIEFGLLLNDILSFLLIALAVFIVVVKVVGYLMRKREEPAAAPPPLTKQEELLTEIRDLLRNRAV
jgi:large conductance mechanosensitive channel